jgi:hypothetical protein
MAIAILNPMVFVGYSSSAISGKRLGNPIDALLAGAFAIFHRVRESIFLQFIKILNKSGSTSIVLTESLIFVDRRFMIELSLVSLF